EARRTPLAVEEGPAQFVVAPLGAQPVQFLDQAEQTRRQPLARIADPDRGRGDLIRVNLHISPGGSHHGTPPNASIVRERRPVDESRIWRVVQNTSRRVVADTSP